MSDRPYDIVILGLSLSSSWGNGHATTWRALIKGLHAQGQRVLFLERNVPWYAQNRDLSEPPYCALAFYDGLADLDERHGAALRDAAAVIVGSYVPDGVAVLDHVLARAGGPVVFYDIDTPVTLAALDRGEATYIAPRQIPTLAAYLSFSGGPLLRQLERTYGARRAIAFHCSVDAETYRPMGEMPLWDLGYLGTYSPDRQPTLEALLIEPARRLPRHRFVVAGPQYPADIDWPTNVERIEHLPPAEHARFYGRQRFTLNVTRADMIAAGWSPSVRLFEAAACGTPIISDDWPGLSELLPEGEAIVIARTTADVVNVLSGDAPALRQAALARQIVLSEHTGVARARQLLAILDRLSRPVPGGGQAGASAGAGVPAALRER